VDEAGRGCLAGPVVAGAVILPEGLDLPGLTDSKKLTAKKRETLETAIRQGATAWNLGVVWPWDIDRVNILQATLRAMARAVRGLGVRPAFVHIDGDKTVPGLGLPQRAVVGGDALVASISAASILAKVHRDRMMTRLDVRYPGYGFAVHKGYGTAAHVEALRRLGPCRMHRMTFNKVNLRAEEARVKSAGKGEAWLRLDI
jgi:ribonuclease HII